MVVNVEALDLGLGSGGFDVVHVNLTRGLDGGGADGSHVLKLNYTSLQHPVDPVERRREARGGRQGPRSSCSRCTVTSRRLWAAAQASRACGSATCKRRRGAAREAVARRRGAARARPARGHVTAGPAYGGEHEAISVVGGLDAAAAPRLGRVWRGRARGSSARRPPRPRRDGGARHRARGACARAADAGLAAALERGPAAAPPRAQPPHRRCSSCCSPVRVPVPEIESRAGRPRRLEGGSSRGCSTLHRGAATGTTWR